MTAFLKLGVLLLKSKVAITLLSMLVSVYAYQTLFGWRFSAGFVLLIFIHEMGHYIAARHRGLDVGAPMFIPFVGAYIALRQVPHNVETEAYVALAGPLLGTVASLACYCLGRAGDDHLMLALAYAGFLMNLFNMIPVSPLDGGRVASVLSPRIWLAGVPILALVFFYTHSPVLILIAVFAYPSLRKALRYDPKDPANAAYYEIKPDLRLFYTTYYLLLTGFLAVMTSDLHDSLGTLG